MLSCGNCGGKARVLSVNEGDAVVKELLAHLGLRTEPLPRSAMRPQAQRELVTRFEELVDEEPLVENLPAWMPQDCTVYMPVDGVAHIVALPAQLCLGVHDPIHAGAAECELMRSASISPIEFWFDGVA